MAIIAFLFFPRADYISSCAASDFIRFSQGRSGEESSMSFKIFCKGGNHRQLLSYFSFPFPLLWACLRRGWR